MPLRRWRDFGKGGAGSSRTPYSLFGEILDWMLAPLLFLWPISIVATHHVAQNIANQPYDRALTEQTAAIARLISVDAKGHLVASVSAQARMLLHADEDDAVYFQVLDAKGELIAGDADLPRIAPGATADEAPAVQFRDAELGGEDVRIASRNLVLAGKPVVIQVAETRNKREQLATRIVTGVLLPQFLVIPATVLLVWLGLTRGISPLSRLQTLIQHRRPADLSPIDPSGVPEEVRPLIIAFNDMMQRLEENMQAQQRFIADAAHQMRTPLAGLRMQAELALSEHDPAALRASLEGIYVSAQRAAHLINQLLALARAEASSSASQVFEPVNLESLVREVASEYVPRAIEKGLDLGVETSGWPLTIDGNPVLLRELLRNLIDNAIKYTPRGGLITVFSCFDVVQPQIALIGVQDDGPGVPESECERVFERFYRVLGSGVEGSGLGLPIVREIAELHGGKVSLGTSPGGRGARFCVEFPRSGEGSLAPNPPN
ncbi:MAG: sensor histidine kinase N-terminal domain-containing protein [Betaproteobacteria bacterium]|nr:sensor histidine kinase N-terminal domain-containing protein [Betaproteobacteria bacterium]